MDPSGPLVDGALTLADRRAGFPASTELLWAVSYLLVFGVGTIAGMMSMTIAIRVPLAFAGARDVQFGSTAAAACGLISAAFGFVLIYRICFVNGLLAGHIR
jgi:hypothetical protein